MKRILFSAGLAAALLTTSACADGYGYRSGLAVGYDGYYDGYYGSVYDGYWRNDGYFYYRQSRRAPWVRDDARHFHRDQFPGGREFHGRRGGRR